MNIIIVHLKRSGLSVAPLFKVDRSTVLGNPASHLDKSKADIKVATVDAAVDYFDQDFKRLYNEDFKAREYLNQIYETAINTDTIYLGCWCMDELDPKQHDHNCHCTVIRRVLLRRYKRESYVKSPQN
jgi:hypothetical protein